MFMYIFGVRSISFFDFFYEINLLFCGLKKSMGCVATPDGGLTTLPQIPQLRRILSFIF